MFNRIAIAVAATMIAGSAIAADSNSGTIIFNGTVTASACSIVAGSKAPNVDLGTVEAGILRQNGVQGVTKDVNIALEKCSNLVLADITFSDPGHNASGALLTNTASSGAATGVGVKVQYKDGQNKVTDLDMSNNVTLSMNSDTEFGTSLNTYVAQMAKVANATNVTAGAVTATLNYTITYK